MSGPKAEENGDEELEIGKEEGGEEEEELPNHMSRTGRKRTSQVWTYFRYDGNKDVSVCIIDDCRAELNGKRPSNMRLHIQRRHPTEYVTLAAADAAAQALIKQTPRGPDVKRRKWQQVSKETSSLPQTYPFVPISSDTTWEHRYQPQMTSPQNIISQPPPQPLGEEEEFGAYVVMTLKQTPTVERARLKKLIKKAMAEFALESFDRDS